jgi:O-antigen/teichoic acid export membrane protein
VGAADDGAHPPKPIADPPRLRPLLDEFRSRARWRSSAVTVSGVLGGALLAFAATIVAARELAGSELAVFGIGLAINSLAVQLSDFGLNTLTVAETAPDWEGGRHRESFAKLRRIAIRRVVVGGGVAVLLTLLTHAIPELEPYGSAAAIGAAGAVLGSPSVFAIAGLQSAHRFRAAGTVLTLVGALRLAGVVAAAVAGFAALEMLVAYAVLAPMLAGTAGVYLLVRGHGGRALAASEEEGRMDPGMQRATAIAAVIGACVLNLDVLLLAIVASEEEVAIYVAAWRVAAGVLLFDTAIANAVLPFIFTTRDLWADTLKLARLGVLLSTGLLLLVPVATVVGVALLGEAGDGAAAPLALLLVAFALDAFNFSTYQVYLRIRGFGRVIRANAVQLAIMVSLTIALQEHGALAPAIGQLAARVATLGIIGAPIVRAWRGGRNPFALESP